MGVQGKRALGEGVAAFHRSDMRGAITRCEQAVGFFAKAGHRHGQCEAMRMCGQCHKQLQNTEKARGYFNDALDVAADEYQRGDVLVALATMAMTRRDWQTATARLRGALQSALKAGGSDGDTRAKRLEGSARSVLGKCLLAQDRVDDAVAEFELALICRRSINDQPYQLVATSMNLASALTVRLQPAFVGAAGLSKAQVEGTRARANALYAEALRLAEAHELRELLQVIPHHETFSTTIQPSYSSTKG
jgi:tetratricopeptide (TPR) repeat protein